MAEVRPGHKHSRLLHKVEVVADEPVVTDIPAVAAQTGGPDEAIEEDLLMHDMDGSEMLGMNIEGSEKSGGKMVWVIAGVLAVVAGLVVGGVVYFSKSRVTLTPVDPTQPGPTGATAALSPTVVVTPTPVPVKLDLSKLKVQVLNGSGVKGKAAKVAGILEGLGFGDITTGNSSKLGFDEMEVKFKPAAKEVQDLLEKELGGYGPYGFGELSESSAYDVVLVVGLKG